MRGFGGKKGKREKMQYIILSKLKEEKEVLLRQASR